MQRKQIARELPEETWAELGPHLPPVVWCVAVRTDPSPDTPPGSSSLPV